MNLIPLGIDVWIFALQHPPSWVSLFYSQAAIALYVAIAGVAVSTITYIFQRRQLKLRGLVEVFKELNLIPHREARRVFYGEVSDASYDILGLRRPDYDGAVVDDIHRVSADIVRSDLNNAATLIEYGLMDESIFIEEYWWIIIRCWDRMKDTIVKRRNSGTGAYGYMRNLETLKNKSVNYAMKRHRKDFEEYINKYFPKTSKDST